MRNKSRLLTSAVIALGLAACKGEDTPTLSATVNPLTIKAGESFTANVEVTNFELSQENYGGSPVDGQGHWHVYLDQVGEDYKLAGSGLASYMVDLPLSAAEGAHNLIFTLQTNDHMPLEPKVEYTVAVTVEAAPPPALNASLSPPTVGAGGAITVTVDVTGFELSQANYGGANMPRQGHYHVYIDQVGEDYLLKASAQSPQMVDIPIDTAEGAHDIIVTLNNNDHSPVTPAVQQTLTLTVEPPPPPALSVTLDNLTIEAGATFLATVNAEYFTLDNDAIDGPNAPRTGHWHAYIDQIGEQYLLGNSGLPQYNLTMPIDTTEGTHTLYFTLNNNDHSPLTPPVQYTVDVTVVVLAPPPPLTVYVNGQITKLKTYMADATEYTGDASVFAFGVDPLQTATAEPDGTYQISVPVNGNVVLNVNKPNYNPTNNTVTTQEANLVGKKLYLAETDWINAIAAYHNVDIDNQFPCHAPALDPATNCIYTVVIGKINDDGYAGQGEIRPVAGITVDDFLVTGGPQGSPDWYKKGPYFLDYLAEPTNDAASTVYYDDVNLKYRGGYFVTFLEVPATDGPVDWDFNISISYADAARGITRYWGPVEVKTFRPYHVSWVPVPETGVPVDQPILNVDFDAQLYPLLGKVGDGGLGCMGCHTNEGGAIPSAGMNFYGGPDVAFAALDPANYPNRVNLASPADSLVLKKPLYNSGEVHPIFAFASEQDQAYQIVYTWIQEGAQRNVVLAPASLEGLRDRFVARGCTTCHYDNVVDPLDAPGGFYMSNDYATFYQALTQDAATDSDALGEAYRVNLAQPDYSLFLRKPLAGTNYLHPVKIWAGAVDPDYVYGLRYVAEGAVGPAQ